MGLRISKHHPFINMDVWANEERGSTFSINIFVTMASFPPSATSTSHQQPERDPTMAMAMKIVTRKKHSRKTRTGYREMGINK